MGRLGFRKGVRPHAVSVGHGEVLLAEILTPPSAPADGRYPAPALPGPGSYGHRQSPALPDAQRVDVCWPLWPRPLRPNPWADGSTVAPRSMPGPDQPCKTGAEARRERRPAWPLRRGARCHSLHDHLQGGVRNLTLGPPTPVHSRRVRVHSTHIEGVRRNSQRVRPLPRPPAPVPVKNC